MVRDSRIRMRDGLVIPGTLLTVYGVLAIIYAEAFRARSDFCADSNLILIAGVCYTVWKLILPLVIIGVALIVAGIVSFRNEPEDLEGHLIAGTPTHTMIAFLVSAVAVPAVIWIIQTIRQRGRTPFELTVLGIRFEHTFLLELAMLVGLLMLIPALVLHFGSVRRHQEFVDAAKKAAAGEDTPLPHEPGFVHDQKAPVQDESMVPDDAWPADRGADDKAEKAELSEEAAEAQAASDATEAKAIADDDAAKDDTRPVPTLNVGQDLGKIPAPSDDTPAPPAPETTFPDDGRCQALTAQGNRCRVKAKDGGQYCGVHAAKQ